VDGIAVGSRPLLSLIDVPDIIQSGRGYQPMLISHYGANWVYGDKEMYYPKEQLSWPLLENGKRYDKDWLRDTLNNAWKTWIDKGGKVHIGEFGCHNQTPHDVALAWLSDQFDIFRENGWGWSLWNLSGSFGVLDSYRKDVKYENFKGHKLDRKMLELLKKA
jgi:endoglucanase